MQLQCQHLNPALNAWAARAKHTTVHLVTTQFPGHGCMDDLKTERSFDSQAMMCLAYSLTYYLWVFVQPVNTVDWCSN